MPSVQTVTVTLSASSFIICACALMEDQVFTTRPAEEEDAEEMLEVDTVAEGDAGFEEESDDEVLEVGDVEEFEVEVEVDMSMEAEAIDVAAASSGSQPTASS